MGKGALFVFLCSVCIVAIFCIMVYLMTTVDPPKLVIPEEVNDSKTTFEENRVAPLILDDNVDTAQYGLEKVDSDIIDFYQTTLGTRRKYPNINNYTGVYRFSPRKVVPPFWPRSPQEVIVNPTILKIMPPIWPTTTVIIDPTVPNNIKGDYRYEVRKTDPKLNETNMKPMRRRSVNNHNADDGGSVILKILGDNGKSRIELKLGSDSIFQKNTLKGFRNIRSKSKFTVIPESFRQHTNIQVKKDTIITIMPNDSIVLDEFEGNIMSDRDITDISNLTELIGSMIFISTRDTNDRENNITGNENFTKMEKPVNEDATIVLAVNETQSLENIMTNNNIFDLSSNIMDTVNDTSTVSTTSKLNISDNNTIANTRISNTDFNRRVFGEEDVMNVTDNDKVLVNDSIYRDLFIENDSDVVVF